MPLTYLYHAVSNIYGLDAVCKGIDPTNCVVITRWDLLEDLENMGLTYVDKEEEVLSAQEGTHLRWGPSAVGVWRGREVLQVPEDLECLLDTVAQLPRAAAVVRETVWL